MCGGSQITPLNAPSTPSDKSTPHMGKPRQPLTPSPKTSRLKKMDHRLGYASTFPQNPKTPPNLGSPWVPRTIANVVKDKTTKSKPDCVEPQLQLPSQICANQLSERAGDGIESRWKGNGIEEWVPTPQPNTTDKASKCPTRDYVGNPFRRFPAKSNHPIEVIYQFHLTANRIWRAELERMPQILVGSSPSTQDRFYTIEMKLAAIHLFLNQNRMSLLDIAILLRVHPDLLQTWLRNLHRM
ncbi:hypothetical protein GQ43DRAFT_466051 [Delitschia confertaspora ATCC 74209]|uniref:Uncharacterized protein n=1 Tax=Delitschia confertaspora ATCC 74209 TaxID=1513339 RepID=A0A9P4JH59_9PLEO|nr:hypothetical protein GQ43DRAFT_466051 [Delitschia confertaspora ATCC 74209]